MGKTFKMLFNYQTEEGAVFPVLVTAKGLLEAQKKAEQIAEFYATGCELVITYILDDKDYAIMKSFIPKQQQLGEVL